jgi:hypothetical protein
MRALGIELGHALKDGAWGRVPVPLGLSVARFDPGVGVDGTVEIVLLGGGGAKVDA